MDYQYVLYAKDGAIVRITLNRPEKLNVFDFPGQGGILDNFYAALGEAEEDDEVKVVVIRGAGRSPCAGHDLTTVGHVYGMGAGQPGERRASQRIRLKVDRRWMECHLKLMLFPKVTIAQVHGHCIGEGTTKLEMCDLAIGRHRLIAVVLGEAAVRSCGRPPEDYSAELETAVPPRAHFGRGESGRISPGLWHPVLLGLHMVRGLPCPYTSLNCLLINASSRALKNLFGHPPDPPFLARKGKGIISEGHPQTPGKGAPPLCTPSFPHPASAH